MTRLTTTCAFLLVSVIAAVTLSSAPADAYFVGSNTITFEGYEEGAPITTQYEPDGILFSGASPEEPPFIDWDGSSLTNPVLSGAPLFHGLIHGSFVVPGTTTPASVDGLALDVGYINDPGSVTLIVETTTGDETLTAEEYGFNHLESEATNITGFRVEEVDYDEAGFEIDNIAFNPASPPPPPPPPPPPAPVASSCTTYAVIDSRGSGENQVVGTKTVAEISPPAAYFASKLRHQHPSATLELISNPYPAVGFGFNWRKILNLIGAGLKIAPIGAYHGSVVDGTNWLSSEIASKSTSCPSTRLFLVGYSQGAQVTADTYQRDVSSDESSHIAGVILFGDPYFNPTDSRADQSSYSRKKHGILGKRPKFSGNGHILSYCHAHDPICQGAKEYLGYHLKYHENYESDGTLAAKQF